MHVLAEGLFVSSQMNISIIENNCNRGFPSRYLYNRLLIKCLLNKSVTMLAQSSTKIFNKFNDCVNNEYVVPTALYAAI